MFRAFLEILKDQIKKPVDFLGRKRKKLSGHLCPIIKPRLAAFYCHFCGGTFPFPYYDPSKTATILWIFLADHACNNVTSKIHINPSILALYWFKRLVKNVTEMQKYFILFSNFSCMFLIPNNSL